VRAGRILALLLLGGGSAHGAAAAGAWKAPPAEKARVNPVERTAATILKGQVLYQKHCASCHGAKGKGDGEAAASALEPPADLTDRDLQARLSDGEILWKMTTGLRDGGDVIMPAIAQRVPLEEDRWKLVLFVRSLAAPASPAP
jgi:mono/diheme cytochrome c family protein